MKEAANAIEISIEGIGTFRNEFRNAGAEPPVGRA
jgi:hypothetical protein